MLHKNGNIAEGSIITFLFDSPFVFVGVTTVKFKVLGGI